MRIDKSHFERVAGALTASVVACLLPPRRWRRRSPATACLCATMADYLSIYDALQHYRWEWGKHDQKMQDSAFGTADTSGLYRPV